MLKNYFTIAFRTLWKNKVFTAINIFGLAIGISASLVIFLLVNYHFSFDKFEKDNDRIYRVVSNFSFSGEIYHNSGVTDPMASAVRRELTGLDAVVPFRTWNGDPKVSIPGETKEPLVLKHEKNVVFADSNYFNLLNYHWLAGSSKISLNNPNSVVLTASNAKHFFAKLTPSQAVGKQIYVDDSIGLTVTGIVQDIVANTDFTFKTFVSYATLEKTSLKPENWDSWGSTNGAQQLFVKLSRGTSVKQVEDKIAGLVKKNKKVEGGDNSKTWHSLQPLKDVHFNGDYGTYSLPVASKATLSGLLAVAVFLLLLGCINFINLTTAQASQRSKEIGIRKTMGSSKKQLVFQFLSETFLLTFLATILSVALTPLILKVFSGFIPEGLRFDLQSQPVILLFLFILIVAVTLLAGFYPSLVLSKFKPVTVLKNQVNANTGKTRNAWLRKSLTVSQFVIAQVFIMATMMVSKQIYYSLNKDMGFKKEAIVYLQTNYYDTIKANKHLLLDKLRAIPEIAMVSLSTNPPSSNSTWSGTAKYKDGKKEVETDVQQKYGDTNYIKLYQVKLLAGRNLVHSDTVREFLINETYARILGFQQPQKAVGKYIEWSDKQIPISGVVADFNQKSLHEPIKPLIIGSWDNPQRTVNIALQPQNSAGTTWKTAIAKIEKAFKEVYPKDDFDYKFFNEDIAKYYESEKNISSLLKWATGLAIFISCLGLLGLVIYTTTQRTKEIGVRKVLGASVLQIVTLISKDFLGLIMLAFVVAVPLSWIAMHKWLENFAYRTDISWGIFVTAGAVMIIIALVTLGFQTIKAATANPVKSLRTE
jgi:putative ABC transport system permease protein